MTYQYFSSRSIAVYALFILCMFGIPFGNVFVFADSDIPPVPPPPLGDIPDDSIPSLNTLPAAPAMPSLETLPAQATGQSPENGAHGIALTTTLSWTPGSGATTHAIYFGTDATLGADAYRGSQTDTTYTPNNLSTNTLYYWRIDEINSVGTTTGSVWSFATIQPSTGGGGGGSSHSGGGGGGGGSSRSHGSTNNTTTPVRLLATTTTTSIRCSSPQSPAVDSTGSPTLTGLIDLFLALGIIPADRAARACEALTSIAVNDNTTVATNTSMLFTKPLTPGTTDPDVARLQTFLNMHGFTVSATGPGSRGQESMYYGQKTGIAVARFQQAYGVDINAGYFSTATLQKVNQLLK